MFKDYYSILGLSINATENDIKVAYREMSKRYHPDRNPNVDVKERMQDINEAYAILKDPSKRAKYDEEYKKHYDYRESKNNKRNDVFNDSNIYDEELKKDIYEAREHAKELVEEFLKSLKNESLVAAKGAWDEAKYMIVVAFVMFILGLALVR